MCPTQGQRCPPEPAGTLRTLHFDAEQPGFVPRKGAGANLGDGSREGEGAEHLCSAAAFLGPVTCETSGNANGERLTLFINASHN